MKPEYATADRISLTGVKVRGYHGVLASEKEEGQDFYVDALLFTDFGPAAAADDVALTVNYAEVAQLIERVVAGPSLDLIETLVEKLAAEILAAFPLRAVQVTVHKPQAPIPLPFEDVAVTVFRESAQ